MPRIRRAPRRKGNIGIHPWTVRVEMHERLSRPQGSQAPPCKLLVYFCPLDLPREFVRRKLPQDPRGSARRKMTGRHFGASLHEAHRPDHRRFADPRVIHDDGVHPDENVGAELRAMNDRAMPDMAIFPDNAIEARHAVQVQLSCTFDPSGR